MLLRLPDRLFQLSFINPYEFLLSFRRTVKTHFAMIA